jgi:hypothetical protein
MSYTNVVRERVEWVKQTWPVSVYNGLNKRDAWECTIVEINVMFESVQWVK